MAGGKGVNIARTLKALGQPVIATGFAGRRHGHPDRRAAHRGVDPQRLRADPRGVAHEHLRARPDDRRADRDQRARAVGVRADEIELFRDKLALPRPRRGDRRLRRLAAARRGPDLYATLVRELRKLGRDDGRRHRRRAAAPGGPRRARRRLAERARGRGARRPRVQRRRGPRAGGRARSSRSAPARRS